MIIIPAAGEGRRFREAGYPEPKHQLPIAGRPMVEWVYKNVAPLDRGDSVVVATQALVGKTKGAIHTILNTVDVYPVPKNEPLIVANCDQLVKLPMSLDHGWGNGLIFTFRSTSSAHSYVYVDLRTGRILGITEKPSYTLSHWQAVSGVYAFPASNVADFLDACREIHDEFDGYEQYVSAAIQRMIDKGFVLYAVEVPTAILGTPEDYQRFTTALEIAAEIQS